MRMSGKNIWLVALPPGGGVDGAGGGEPGATVVPAGTSGLASPEGTPMTSLVTLAAGAGAAVGAGAVGFAGDVGWAMMIRLTVLVRTLLGGNQTNTDHYSQGIELGY